MRARSNLVSCFSSFLQFEADRASGWVSDRRLQQNMQRCCAQTAISRDPEMESEKYWALHWHKCWFNHWQTEQKTLSTSGVIAHPPKPQFSQAHLLAYLQEPCYWVAYKTSTRFPNTQYGVSEVVPQ